VLNRLAGNDPVKITMRRLIGGGRIPHSLLFAGDEGVGKRQFALELAKSLLCATPEGTGEACGACPSCRRADTFTYPKSDDKDAYKRVIFSDHPDVGTIIPYNRSILVDSVRHLEAEANFRPYEAGARIFIVDDVDKMNPSASNALLKTLEEPPETTYIFLITSRPDSLLPTIRSRCQTLRFAPVGITSIEQFLIGDRAFSHDEARLASRLSRGSVGRAVSINVAAFTAMRDRMLNVLRRAILGKDRAGLLKLSEEASDAKNKDSFEESLDTLESLIHDVWLISLGAEQQVLNVDLQDELANLAAAAEPGRFPHWVTAIEKMRSDLIVNINKRISADALFMTMTV
jgi:DNA polymerase III subunit delta'